MYIHRGSVNVHWFKNQQIIFSKIFRCFKPTHLNNKFYYIYMYNIFISSYYYIQSMDMCCFNLYMNMCLPLSEAASLRAWDYACLLWNLCSLGWRDRNAVPKRCYYCQSSRSQSPLNPFAHGATYCWLWLHHPPVVNILLLLPPILPYSSFTSTLFFPPYVHESYGTGNYNIISGSLKNSNFHRIFDTSKNMFKNIFSNLY